MNAGNQRVGGAVGFKIKFLTQVRVIQLQSMASTGVDPLLVEQKKATNNVLLEAELLFYSDVCYCALQLRERFTTEKPLYNYYNDHHSLEQNFIKGGLISGVDLY